MKKVKYEIWAETQREILWPVIKSGFTLDEIATMLNNRCFRTYKDCLWSRKTVAKLIKTLKKE